MPDNKFRAGVACGAATVLGLGGLGVLGVLGTQPGLRHHLAPLVPPVRLA